MKQKDEFLGTSEIKIISNIYRHSLERIVIVEGEETFRDYHVLPCSPPDEDPIRILQMFLFGEKPQDRTDRCCNFCDTFRPEKSHNVYVFSKLLKFISNLIKRTQVLLYKFQHQ